MVRDLEHSSGLVAMDRISINSVTLWRIRPHRRASNVVLSRVEKMVGLVAIRDFGTT